MKSCKNFDMWEKQENPEKSVNYHFKIATHLILLKHELHLLVEKKIQFKKMGNILGVKWCQIVRLFKFFEFRVEIHVSVSRG